MVSNLDPHAAGMKGGAARAAALSPRQRSEIARTAAQARWGKSYVDATHAGSIVIGDKRIDCAVLEDRTRVVNQGTVLAALGREVKTGRRGVTDGRPPFLAAGNLVPFFTDELVSMFDPIEYQLPGQTGVARSVGYRAEILPLVCYVYIDANKTGKLTTSQKPIADAAEVLVRGLTRIGILALVDEATGYQEVRARYELQRILEAYVHAELRPWIKRFPDEFFKQIYRLQGWEFKPGTSQRNQSVGKWINKYIYKQLPPGVMEELQRRNPANENGQRAHKHHQYLSEGTGNVHLDRQISSVTTLMRAAQTRAHFEELFMSAFPPPQDRLPLVIDVDWQAID